VSITQAKVAIITVTFNCSDFIEDYLISVTPFITQTNNVIIIVDNNSSDNSCDLIKRHIETYKLEDNIIITSLSENVGFGKGCNKGAEIAREHQSSHLWFLNPDTKVLNNSGDALLCLLEQNPAIHFAGSILLNENSIPRAGAFRFPSLLNVFLSNMRLGLLDRAFQASTTAAPIRDSPYEADWLTGASFMTRAEYFYRLGGFDPFYFLYFEEVDLFYRAKQLGYSAWACPDSRVFHISGASTGINTQTVSIRRQPSYWFESRRHYYINNYGQLYFLLADAVFIIAHTMWGVRATLQKKALTTPAHIIKDTLLHGYFRWLPRKKGGRN
jgi:N-acetylglucosaminyl-diphospho-decaprenol L-rhamnosyltransferase